MRGALGPGSVIKVDTTNWQEYVDNERGFSFKYPNDWTLKEVPYKKHRMYKDCYKMPGMERGGCGDKFAHYDIKTTLHPTTFLCLNPNNENLNGDCFIAFSQIDPILKNVGTTVDVYEKNYREPIDAQYVKFTNVNDELFFTGATTNSSFEFIVKKIRMLEIFYTLRNHKKLICKNIDQNKYSIYQLPQKAYSHLCFAVPQEEEKIFHGIIQSINIIKK